MNIMWSFIFLITNTASDEIWEKKLPQKGCHIRVCRGIYYHHGIYISDKEVIHYSALDDDGITDWSKCKVVITDINEFLKDGMLEVRKYKKREKRYIHSIENIIEKARKCVGKKGYNLIFNNCEHFANDCVFGEKKSTQVKNALCVSFSNPTSAILMPVVNFLMRKSCMGFLFVLGAIATAVLSTDSKKVKSKKTKYINTTATVKSDIEDVIEKSLRYEDLEKAEDIKNTLISIKEKSSLISERRIQIIERGSLDLIKQIETLYDDMIDKIKKENEDYVNVKLPSMFKNLEKYDNNKEIYEIYKKVIQDDISMKFRYYESYMDMLLSHQNILIESIVENKNRMNKDLDLLTEKILHENRYEICA